MYKKMIYGDFNHLKFGSGEATYNETNITITYEMSQC